MDYTDSLACAVAVARGAGEIVRARYGKVARLTKRDAEAVTEADREVQRFIIAGLRAKFPADGMIGEESDQADAITFDRVDPAGRAWVIDPIDGTNNFITGFGHFAVCIGLLDKGMPVVGVVLDVCQDRLFTACAGQGAWEGSRRLHAATTRVDEPGGLSLLMLASNVGEKVNQMPLWAQRLYAQSSWKIRCTGSAALEIMQVAQGVAHGSIEVHTKLWDIVAPAAILLEAGGVVTRLNGDRMFPFSLAGYTGTRVDYLVAAPVAHESYLRALAGAG